MLDRKGFQSLVPTKTPAFIVTGQTGQENKPRIQGRCFWEMEIGGGAFLEGVWARSEDEHSEDESLEEETPGTEVSDR